MDVYESLFALSSTPEVMWSIMASFMLYEYAWDFYIENANWLELTSSTAYRSKHFFNKESNGICVWGGGEKYHMGNNVGLCVCVRKYHMGNSMGLCVCVGKYHMLVGGGGCYQLPLVQDTLQVLFL